MELAPWPNVWQCVGSNSSYSVWINLVGHASVNRMVFSVRWYALSVSLSLGGDGAFILELLCRRGVTVGTAKG